MATMEDQFRNAKHVFVAQIETVGYESRGRFNERAQVAGYKVVKQLKESGSKPRSLRSGYGYGDCGVPLVAGLQYLVLVNDSGEIGLCSGFYGPQFGWTDGRPKAFLDSVTSFYRQGTKIIEPPRSALGIEDSYVPPPPPPLSAGKKR